MFEDALVESTGKLQTKSRYWMLATLAFNVAVLATLILLPLLHPQALPRTAMAAMLTAPPPPPAAVPAARPPQTVRATTTVAPLDPATAPSRVPRTIDLTKEAPPPQTATGVASGAMAGSTGQSDGINGALAVNVTPVVIPRPPERPRQTGPLTISRGVAEGYLLARITPRYPAIAIASHTSGAVVLHAIISKTGTIEALQVVSGPEMLRASALDAVRQWRYKPYLLNSEPTEVETTVTVNFSFGS